MKRAVVWVIALVVAEVSFAQTQEVEVLEYHPAPGQFVNTLPEAEEGDSHEDMCAKCAESLNDGELVHLGTYGGYITVKFDHAVKNKLGSDLRIKGNGFYSASDPKYGKETIGGSFEPGIVYVGVGNSVESAQWYELAGSEYYTGEIHDFSITYHKPSAESGDHSQNISSYDNYIYWESTWTENGKKKSDSGYHIKNTFHSQSYWPMWEEGETLTFTGGKLPDNAVDYSGKGTNWVLYRYAKDSYGYVDASLNTDDYSTFDISWAVDKEGKHVDLEEVNYIRVVSAMFQYCGWLGETSTEVSGFEDLHLEEGYDEHPIIINQRTPSALKVVKKEEAGRGEVYNLMGVRVRKPSKGLYVKDGRLIMVGSR